MPSLFGVRLSPRGMMELPGIRNLGNSFLLRSLRGKDLGRFRGKFPTRQRAVASLPPSAVSEYDDEQLVEVNLESFSQIHPFDWPVVALCQRLMREGRMRVLTDFGGHIGVKYYAFEPMLDQEKELTWQVVDVPAMIREGRRRLKPENTSLKFYERLEETEPCDALLLSGVVQYSDRSIEEIVASLPKKPYIIFLNKVPVSDGVGYFTIEKYIKPLPYRVYGRNELEGTRERMGYHRLAQWPIPHRDIITLNGTSMEQVHMLGEAWCLEELK
ncbi:MAG TPA: methyltransferase, TIGR04325 family [Edaphobacter sp.]